jgi:ribosomal protein S18 acetylase RimI-like enzyme
MANGRRLSGVNKSDPAVRRLPNEGWRPARDEVIIREFDLERDYAAAHALWLNSSPGVHVGLSDTREEIAKKLLRDPDLFLVAEEDGQLTGTVIGGYDGRRGMVYHLAVAEARRGRGVGKKLMVELEARLKAKGCLKYYLLVTAQNLKVVEYYQRLGWGIMPLEIMGKEIK